jgi:hypothetical protein
MSRGSGHTRSSRLGDIHSLTVSHYHRRRPTNGPGQHRGFQGGDMQQLDAIADIDAPPERVWAVITDLSSFALESVHRACRWRTAPRRSASRHPPRAGDVSHLVRSAASRRRTWARDPLARRHAAAGSLRRCALFERRTTSERPQPLPHSRRRHGDPAAVLGKVMRRTQRGFELLAEAVKARAEAS